MDESECDDLMKELLKVHKIKIQKEFQSSVHLQRVSFKKILTDSQKADDFLEPQQEVDEISFLNSY